MKRYFYLLLVAHTIVVLAACLVPPSSHVPTATVDNVASCLGPDGQTRCGDAPRWNRSRGNIANGDSSFFGASSGGDRAAVIPPSWTVATWDLDTQNYSGCASDNNNGTQSTCGSAGSFQGPLLTYGELAARWGTYYPRIRQSVAITNLGSLNTSDVMYINPSVEATSGVYVTLSCALGAPQVAWTTTLGTVIPENRNTPQLLNAIIAPSSGTVAINQYVVNTTHPSSAHITSNSSGSAWNLTQPITGCAAAGACSPSESFNTWAMNDTVTGYNLSNIYLVQALPTAQQDTQVLFINNCNLQCPGARSTCSSYVNSSVILANGSSFTQENPADAGGAATSGGNPWNPYHVNFNSAGSFGSPNYYYGGRVGEGGQFNTMAGVHLDGGVELFNSIFMTGSSLGVIEGAFTFGDVYINGLLDLDAGFANIGTGGTLWGPGAVRVEAGSFLQYQSGAGAVATFLQTGTNEGSQPLILNGAATACSHTGAGTDVVSCGISLTPTNLDTAQSGTAFGGLAYAVGGGQISKAAQ